MNHNENEKIEKSAGQLAYERDLAQQPNYQDGGRRRTWDQLNEVVKDSWHRNPTDRKRTRATHVAALVGRIFSRCAAEDIDGMIARLTSVHPDADAAGEGFEHQMRGVGCIRDDSVIYPEFSHASGRTVGFVRRLLVNAFLADGIDEWSVGSAATLVCVDAINKSGPPEREYAFDCTLTTSLRVKGTSRQEAEARLREQMSPADCNGGAWENGDPVLFEASISDRAPVLYEVDGEPIEDGQPPVAKTSNLGLSSELLAMASRGGLEVEGGSVLWSAAQGELVVDHWLVYSDNAIRMVLRVHKKDGDELLTALESGQSDSLTEVEARSLLEHWCLVRELTAQSQRRAASEGSWRLHPVPSN